MAALPALPRQLSRRSGRCGRHRFLTSRATLAREPKSRESAGKSRVCCATQLTASNSLIRDNLSETLFARLTRAAVQIDEEH
jgi:hypothetical protein